ncbi:hypothetical protein AAVH_18461 [Aphelenchoides avenae]|nr:hypothetical protein AAVH_18461 [Aphelenchus avenae]
MENSALDSVGLKLDECLASYKAAYNSRICQLEKQLRQQEVELREKDAVVRQKNDDISELRRELQARMQEIEALRNESTGTHNSPGNSARLPAKRHSTSVPVTASKKQKVTEISKRHPFIPGEVWIDVFSPLSRYQLDAIHFTSRRFRRIVDDSMSSVCLRPIDSVALKHPNPWRVPDAPAPLCSSAGGVHPQRLVCGVRFTYTKLLPMAARPSGSAEPTGDRATGKIPFKQEEVFYSMLAAVEYACGLLRCATVESLSVYDVPLTQEFFTGFDKVAPTLSVRRLSLTPQRNSNLPEAYFRTLLKLIAVQHIRVQDENAHADHLGDDVLTGMAAKSLVKLHMVLGPDGGALNAHFNVTDDGILAFLFRERHENATLYVDTLPISKNFSKLLLQSALQSTSNARVRLKIGRRVDVSSQESELAEAFGEYRREHRPRSTYNLPITAGMQIRLRFMRTLNGGALQFRCVPIGASQKRPDYDYDSTSSASTIAWSRSSYSDEENNNNGGASAGGSESDW